LEEPFDARRRAFLRLRRGSRRFTIRWVSILTATSMSMNTMARTLRLGLLSVAALGVAVASLCFAAVRYEHRRGGAGMTGSVHAASRVDWSSRPWTDRFGDGTPDFLRLTDPADRAAFRRWFTEVADYQAVRPRADVPAEITDCASLLRYAYREALKRHDDTWFAETGVETAELPGEVRAWHYPDTPLGAGLFRVKSGGFEREDTGDGAFAQFADAKTLVERNAYLVTRDARRAEPGDLLFFKQFGQSSPWHSMIVTRIGGQAAVVYDTGMDHGHAGELRRVTVAELVDHPQPQWRPVAANPNFMGVYRWNILRGNE
jgi:uncharacterized protein YfaT (DUF1175 family)